MVNLREEAKKIQDQRDLHKKKMEELNQKQQDEIEKLKKMNKESEDVLLIQVNNRIEIITQSEKVQK